MGCGCKNKGNQQQAAQPQVNQSVQKPQANNNATVQESVKKVIEKYYNKR